MSSVVLPRVETGPLKPPKKNLSSWQLWGIVLIAPYLLVFLVLVLYPVSYGLWLARRLLRVDVRLSPDDGHLTLPERRVGEVHAFLQARF